MKDDSPVFLVNPFIHETAGLTRAEFVHRVRRVKAIRTDDWLDRGRHRPFLTLIPNGLDQWLALERFHTLVNKGRFEFLYEEFGRHFFVVTLSPRLFAWLKNVDLAVLQKQIVNWFAAVGVVQHSGQDKWFEGIYAPLVDEARQLIRQHYAPCLDIEHLYDGKGDECMERIAKLRQLYIEVSKTLTGSAPPSIFQLFDHERELVTPADGGVAVDRA